MMADLAHLSLRNRTCAATGRERLCNIWAHRASPENKAHCIMRIYTRNLRKSLEKDENSLRGAAARGRLLGGGLGLGPVSSGCPTPTSLRGARAIAGTACWCTIACGARPIRGWGRGMGVGPGTRGCPARIPPPHPRLPRYPEPCLSTMMIGMQRIRSLMSSWTPRRLAVGALALGILGSGWLLVTRGLDLSPAAVRTMLADLGVWGPLALVAGLSAVLVVPIVPASLLQIGA